MTSHFTAVVAAEPRVPEQGVNNVGGEWVKAISVTSSIRVKVITVIQEEHCTFCVRKMHQNMAGPRVPGSQAVGLPPTEGLPFIFYFSLMIDAYDTTT